VKAKISVDLERTLGSIDDRVYGTFAEHIGRVIYGGLYDPESDVADADGLRTDVIEAVREMGSTIIRWPGGNFASGYHWRDGIGPKDQRPGRHDLAWDVFDPNTFGTEEFLAFCRKAGAAPYLNFNASTGDFDEAQGWIEYCNGRHPVPEVLARQAGPHPDPHDVKLWGIGNENYGWWQHAHASAESYAETLREWGKLAYWTDSSIEIVGVGASPMPDWNWTVLTQAGRSMDYLSLHFYWNSMPSDPYHSVLAGPIGSEAIMEGAWGMALEAQRKLGLVRPVRFAIDEWGVWNDSQQGIRDSLADLSKPMRYGLTPKIGIDNKFEEFFDVKDALGVATWFNVMWRHPEKIALATYAQVVNTLAPLFVGENGLVKQATFFPLAISAKESMGTALDVLVLTDEGVPAPLAGFAAAGGGGSMAADSIPVLDAAGTTDGHRIHLSLVNRSRDTELEVTVAGVAGTARRIVLTHDDPFACNTPDSPRTVVPVEDKVEVNGTITLPPASHTTLVFE